MAPSQSAFLTKFWQFHSPRLSHMLQDEACDFAVGDRIPVHTIMHPVLQAETKLEVQVQHIEAKIIGKSGSKVIRLDHIES